MAMHPRGFFVNSDSRKSQSSVDADQHGTEVKAGRRFEFGKNWARFLATLNDQRIALAEQSLKSAMHVETLAGKTFLDVGSGSGLFSLVARRLGAKVHSFDYDPQSVQCTRELRRRYFPDSPDWTVERGSALDPGYLSTLGIFDIVYSWGVLHHTGSMYSALDNVKPLVRLGGLLYVAIYNDLGPITDRWFEIKRKYNSLPKLLKLPYALRFIVRDEAATFRGHLRAGKPLGYFKTWTEYDKESTRGMSRWHDWIDWIGGYPYERATIEEIVDVYAKDGFRLFDLIDRRTGYGCNEFVFQREAPAGTFVQPRIPGSQSLLKRCGHRIEGPFEQTADGWVARTCHKNGCPDGGKILFCDDRLVGSARPHGGDEVVVAGPEAPNPNDGKSVFQYVVGSLRQPEAAFQNARGRMWIWQVPDLEHLADNGALHPQSSPVFLFENGKQLAHPHAMHDDIVKLGAGRYSHWGKAVLFSTLDDGDPNRSADRFRLVVPNSDE